MDKRELIKIAKLYGEKINFADMEVAGCCNLKTKDIFINENLTQDQARQTLFHELGHCDFIKRGIYQNYHNHKKPLKDRIKIGLRVERAVDKWAEREYQKFFPQGRFISVYAGKEGKRNYYKNHAI